MNRAIAREVTLATGITDELGKAQETLRHDWKDNPSTVSPKKPKKRPKIR